MPSMPESIFRALFQAGSLPAGRVDLRNIAGQHHLGAFASARQNHFQRFQRGVLPFIQHQERIVERTPAHIGDGGYLYDAFFQAAAELLPALKNQTAHRTEGRRYGSTCVLQIAGQKAKLFPRLHSRSGQG